MEIKTIEHYCAARLIELEAEVERLEEENAALRAKLSLLDAAGAIKNAVEDFVRRHEEAGDVPLD